MRRWKYGVAGGVLGLGAPAGLLLLRSIRHELAGGSLAGDLQGELDIYVYMAVSSMLVFGLFGGILGHLADQLARLATTDPLTALFNTRAFDERLHQELGRAARYREPLSVLVVDLDRLKRINDSRGHPAGDVALRSVADAIRSGLREIDFAARLGGDEFGVLLPRTDEASSMATAERLRALAAEGVTDRAGRRVTVSIGVASLSGSDEPANAASLLEAADRALYAAKGAGGNRVEHAARLGPPARARSGA
jgi:diguanylate cyclase (GGDEF)-like protein